MWLRKKGKKLKSLIGFLSANKIDIYNRGRKKEKKKKKENSTELQKDNAEAEVYKNNTMWIKNNNNLKA